MALICDFHSVANETAEQEKKAQRSSFVCIAIGAAVLAGLFLPLPNKLIDVLIILSLSLTVAAVIICLAAKKVSDISGFEYLIRATTLLRSFLVVICTKLILTRGNIGIIVGHFKNVFSPDNMIFVILTLPLLSCIAFIFIFRAARKIRHNSRSFIRDAVPMKLCQIAKELNMHLIGKTQAGELKNLIDDEKKLFENLEKVSTYILYDGINGFVFIVICLAGGLLIGTAGRTISTIHPATYIFLTFGVMITLQVPSVVTALAFNLVIQKNYDVVVKIVKSETFPPQRINVISSEVKKANNMKSQVGDRTDMCNIDKTKTTMITKQPQQEPLYKEAHVNSKNAEITKELKWLDEKQISTGCRTGHLWNFCDIKGRYEEASELFTTCSDNTVRTILMGAERQKTLPVTIPVNIAIKLAGKGRKCLLIDLDYQRDSVARVFELHKHILDEHIPSGHTITGIPTCVRNLWIYPSCWLTENTNDLTTLDYPKINQIITHLKIKYDNIIIYSPNLNKHHNCELIGECIDAAMLFGKPSLNLRKAFELVEQFECVILKPEQIPAHASRTSR